MRRSLWAAIVATACVLLTLAFTPPAYAAPPLEEREEVAWDTNGRREVFYVAQGAVVNCYEIVIGGGSMHCNNFGYIAAVGTPAAANDCLGRMHVFVLNGQNGHLYVKWQVTAGNYVWSDPWYDMGGFLTSNPDAYRNDQGRFEVFGRGRDNAVWTKWQNAACGSWSNWASIYGQIIDYPRVASFNENGLVTVAATGTDNNQWIAIRRCFNCAWAWELW